MRVLLLALACLGPLGQQASRAGDYIVGKVAAVPDGDTLLLDVSTGPDVKVRLYAIDCPEIAQPHGPAAREFTEQFCSGERVTAVVHDVDGYGRPVCEVFLNGKSLNRSLLARGHAWWYARYAADDHDAKTLAYAARRSGIGLFQQADPIEPWRWRRGVRPRSVPREVVGPAAAIAEAPVSLTDELEEAFETEDNAGEEELALGDVIAPELTGQALAGELRGRYRPDSTLSYRDAREAMFSDIDNVQGEVRLVYSGAWFATHGVPDHTVVNTEHTWPQSRFQDTGGGPRMKSDLHHLFATYSKINSDRGNKRFAEIDDLDTVKWWVSRTPEVHPPALSIRDEFSESTAGAFEPREGHKGNVARAMFYLATVYEHGSSNRNWYEQQVDTFVAWHEADPADDNEFRRTLRVGDYQGNINPFVIDPTLVDRLLEED